MSFCYRPLAVVLIAATGLLCGAAGAVELGDTLMRSHIGQPLSADIELTGLATDTVPVQAAVADLDIYRAASTALPPALDGAAVTIVRRDGRRYVHLASPVAVKSDHIVVFLALTENGQRVLRQTTLWLTADPHPAPPVALPQPGPAQAAGPAAAVAAAIVAPAVMPAAPAAPGPAVPATPRPVVAAFVPAPASVRHAVTLPRRAASAPACASSPVEADPVCAALDGKNAALNAHLAELEAKVKQLTALQGAAGAGTAAGVAAAASGSAASGSAASAPAASVAAAASATASAPPAAPVVHKPAPVLPAKLVPMGSAPPPASGGRPWLVIGIVAAIILSLVAGLTVMLVRQRRRKLKHKASEVIAAAARPSFISNVKNRLKPGKPIPADPVVEQAEAANTEPAL